MKPDILAICRRACELFGGADGQTFNSANFSHAVQEATGLNQPLDGIVVSLILSDRFGIESLKESHWRLNQNLVTQEVTYTSNFNFQD